MDIVTTSPLPDGNLDTPYSQTLAQSGGVAPFSWLIESGNLPNGLTLDEQSGLISGVPGSLGTFSFVVRLQDSAT